MDKEQLTEQALQKALQWAESAEAFTAEQAPLVVAEIINWGISFYAIGLGVSALFLLAGALGLFVFFASEDNDAQGFGITTFIVSGGVGVMLSAVNGFGLAKVLIAPRLYVLQELGRMIGN